MQERTPIDRFMDHYAAELAVATREHPEEYGFPPEQVLEVASRMRAAFERGSYNHDGRAIKATCKKLGIKYTRKAIEEFFGRGKRT